MFACNIKRKGRAVRAILGGGLTVSAGIILFSFGRPWPFAVMVLFWILLVSGLFVLFEAIRGWCILRAMGLKTPV